MSEIQTKLDYADEIADWFLELSDIHISRSDLEKGLKCTHVAAAILSRQNRILSSSRVESNLRFIANRLAKDNRPLLGSPCRPDRKAVCLHVLDEALQAGGLTAMAIRWIKNDQSGRLHSVVLLAQPVPIPDDLLQAVHEKGGSIYIADPAKSFLHRAAWLKKLANDLADCVILHIGVADVITGVAFGTKDGPPVILVNHAAHIFWMGTSIADLVVNCRGSALEVLWTTTYRDARCATVPIPLLEPNSPTYTCETMLGVENKRQAKKALGIPADSTVILTVGAFHKYLPVGGLDFVAVIESILEEIPEAFFLAVGLQADSRWSQASNRLGSRIRALGVVPRSQLVKIHEATDIYVEGFPMGTTTALLEAGLKGIPVVLAPALCPPPYASDGVALDDTIERPASIEDYKAKVIHLSRSHLERLSCGNQIRAAISRHHTGAGWQRYLEAAMETLPLRHSVRSAITPVRTPEAVHEYWSAFVAEVSSGYEEALEHAVTRALLIGVRPRLTKTVMRACKTYTSVRIHRSIPLPLLFFLCNCLLPLLPMILARNVFRLFSFLCRQSFLERLHKRLRAIFGGTGAAPSWYEDYRNVRADDGDNL